MFNVMAFVQGWDFSSIKFPTVACNYSMWWSELGNDVLPDELLYIFFCDVIRWYCFYLLVKVVCTELHVPIANTLWGKHVPKISSPHL